MEEGTLVKDERLLLHLSQLEQAAYPGKGRKKWLKHLSLIGGELDINNQQIEDDFNREIKIYGNTLTNCKSMLERLVKSNIPIWRPNDFKAETFKSDEHMKKVQKHLEDIKTKYNVVEKRKDAKNKKKFGNEAHKRHVKSKQMKNLESKAKRKRTTNGSKAKRNFKRKRS